MTPECPSKLSVLVVEDDRQMRAMVASILRRAGHDVRLAVDGAEGLEALKAQPPDVVLLDLAMPRLGGAGFRAVQTRLRTDLASIPVIVVSGQEDAPDEARRLGVAGCLRKPFVPDALLEAVATSTRPVLETTTQNE